MEVDTVLLSVEDYNDLRDFKKGIDDDKFVYVNYYGKIVYYAEEREVIKCLKLRESELEADIKELKSKLKKANETIKVVESGECIKENGYFNFLNIIRVKILWKRKEL